MAMAHGPEEGDLFTMAKLLTAVVAALALASCRTPLRQMNDANLCSMYGSAGLAGTPTAKYRAEIDRRGLISDWSHVDAHEIGVGMNECEALAVSGATDVSRKVTPQGEVKVYRFRRGNSLWTVTVNNGRVANVIPPGLEGDVVKGPDSRYR
jgi:hypothetical protein